MVRTSSSNARFLKLRREAGKRTFGSLACSMLMRKRLMTFRESEHFPESVIVENSEEDYTEDRLEPDMGTLSSQSCHLD
ncbi:hypothetical protein Tco_1320214 [Tanacetum coccineum]